MLKCFLQRPLRLVLTLTLLSVVAQAQNSTNPITPQVKIASASQINAALSALPEADTLIYINPQRILNEVAPKVLPEADVHNRLGGLYDDDVGDATGDRQIAGQGRSHCQ